MKSASYEDRYVRVNGRQIRYWVEGEGPALILVHGLAASLEYWQYNIAALATQHRVYALDLLGFGRSDKEIEDFSLSYAASFLAQFMDALGIERAHLVGNSLGGVVCAQTAVQFPERVDSLVLVGSAGFGRELNPLLRLWSVPVLGDLVFKVFQMAFPLAKRWALDDPRRIDDEWLASVAAVLRTPGLRENTLKIAREGVDLRGQREEMFRSLHRGLGGTDVPTLIVWGSRDVVVPLSHAYTAQRLISKSEVSVMERCGHVPQVERPEEFNGLVQGFLATIPRPLTITE
jgi:pimeloyl-ACP methyl ester carboxylesterase